MDGTTELRVAGQRCPATRDPSGGIAHLHELIPHKKAPKDKIKLPKRSGKGEYDDQSTMKGRNFVPETY
jgi:hypothetical protein